MSAGTTAAVWSPLAGPHLPPHLEAQAPPEATGAADRSDVRLMVSVGSEAPLHTRFAAITQHLAAGDLLVVNTSGTLAAALDGELVGIGAVVVHFSTAFRDDRWVVEVRRPTDGTTVPWDDAVDGDLRGSTVAVSGGGLVHLVRHLPGSARLWIALVATPEPAPTHLRTNGRPIRYSYVPRPWPIGDYQTVFARDPGSAEMPSASRPFTAEIVVELVTTGVVIAPVTLHTGVSSLERHERPYAERFTVPATTARLVNDARAAGGRVVAAGTTVVRALESAVGEDGRVHQAAGWTDLLVTPERGVAAVDGLLTGWHEPEATHLLMLEAVAGRRPLELAYAAAVEHDYRWHEFGDTHLLLPRSMVTPVPLPLSEARRDVLYAVRRRGEATVDEVADALGITVSGARQHLAALADSGLVVARDLPGSGPGRPRRVHRVTAAADSVFPRAYGELTNELLDYLDDDLEATLFDRRRDQRVARAEERLAGLDLEGRVAELARILDEDGYLATWRREDDGSYSVIERNCAIAAVAVAHPQACRSELDFIRTVLPGTDVERVHHMVAGAPECGYRITPA